MPDNADIHIFCPLCDVAMRQDGDYYRCNANQLHAVLIIKEWNQVYAGGKTIEWLRWRMKVRLGKMVQRKSR